ncbi:Integration host factor beta subunit [hydrothermal vent metagenome]|uniref:Integration host factor beta subunit n=1 Tax=hydrothermal vent metagenome TaxID=652676 RepID=A0A1W1C8U6_9ZZZZ
MNKSELITSLCDESGLSHKEVKLSVDILFQTLEESLVKNERIEIRGFGSFYHKKRKPFIGTNPKTRKKIAIPEKVSIAFRPSKTLKELLN